jgi:hypothetical protein
VAPRPASWEDASLQVGPESDWRLACCSCAHVDAITIGSPMVTLTATPVSSVDWPVTFVLNVTNGPCWGVPRVAALVLKTYLFSPLRRPRGVVALARATVRFFAPSNRRAGCMTCGPGPPCWTAGCSEAEGAHCHGAVVRYLRDGSPS